MTSFTIPEIVTNMGGDQKNVSEAINRFLFNRRELENFASRFGSVMSSLSCRDKSMDLDKLTAYQILRATGAVTVNENRSWVSTEILDGRLEGGGTVVDTTLTFNDEAIAEVQSALGKGLAV